MSDRPVSSTPQPIPTAPARRRTTTHFSNCMPRSSWAPMTSPWSPRTPMARSRSRSTRSPPSTGHGEASPSERRSGSWRRPRPSLQRWSVGSSEVSADTSKRASPRTPPRNWRPHRSGRSNAVRDRRARLKKARQGGDGVEKSRRRNRWEPRSSRRNSTRPRRSTQRASRTTHRLRVRPRGAAWVPRICSAETPTERTHDGSRDKTQFAGGTQEQYQAVHDTVNARAHSAGPTVCSSSAGPIDGAGA